MSFGDDSNPFGMGLGGGCPEHGDENMRECPMCGIEFCGDCNPNMRICDECQEQTDQEAALDDDDDDRDDEEKELTSLLDEEDDEVDQLLEDADSLDLEDEGLDDEEER